DLMELTEKMLTAVVLAVTGTTQSEFRGQEVDFSHFDRYSLVEAIRQFWPGAAPPSLEELESPERLKELLASLEVNVPQDCGWGKLLGTLFETVAEPNLIQPTFI
ncbi:MAG: lysine--tRNA ligase, partial [bacterium]